ncbi:MAG: hypothetical protein ACXAB2_06600 [Candidatus Hodarchaeales archaeon]
MFDGVHNVTVIITDSPGNTGTATIIFTVDIQTTTTTTTSTTNTTSTTTPRSPTNGWSTLVLFLSMIT